MIKILYKHLVFEGQFTAEDRQKYFPLSFHLPGHVNRIELKMTYHPLHMRETDSARQMINKKIQQYKDLYSNITDLDLNRLTVDNVSGKINDLLPLRNHLNFSVYAPGGRFRGRWDTPHHYAKKIIISEKDSETSNGFLSGKLRQGCWTAELETHGINSPELKYRIDVWVYQEKKKYNWYKGELHLHSHHSDGRASVGDLVKAAVKNGLDFFALTDHNTVSGWSEIDEDKFVIIPGMEFSTYYGHAVALGIREYIDWRTEDNNSDLTEIIKEVHRQDGLFSIAHPFQIGSPICMGCEWEYQNVSWPDVDLLEIWSRGWQKPQDIIKNVLAQKVWNHQLISGVRIIGVGSNDLHDPDYYNHNSFPLTYVKAEALTVPDLLNGLVSGKVYISSGPELEFKTMSLEGRDTGEIGDTIFVEPGKAWQMKIIVSGLDQPAEICLFQNGEMAASHRTAGGSNQIRFSKKCRPVHNDYYYCALKTVENGELLAVTNPIFFKDRGEQNE